MASHADMIRAHFEAWNARDREGMVRDLAEDIVIEEDPDFQLAAGVHHGHAAAFALWNQLFEVATKTHTDVLEIEELDGARALVLMQLHAKLRFSDIEAAYEMAHVWHFRDDGKACRVQVFGSHEKARAAAHGDG